VHLGPSGPWNPNFDPTVTVEELISLMKNYNLEKAVVFPNPLPGSKYPKANNYILSCMKRYPTKLIGFGRIDPRYGKEVFVEIKRLAENKIKGIKLHPVVECFRPDHPFFSQVYECIVNSGIKFVLTHSSDEGFAKASYWSVVAKKFPELNIILAHLNKTCIPLLEEFSNVYTETSASSTSLIEKACAIDSSKIMFGSDYPYSSYTHEINKIMKSTLSSGEMEKVLYKNFERIFYG
jgi:predicted TIM-barrel fold metal-dependent hydrolase